MLPKQLERSHPQCILSPSASDLAKHAFQVHGVDAAGKVVIRKKLRRSELQSFFEKLPPCVVGMEVAGRPHYWGRELTALGHDVKLMPRRLC